MRKLNEIDIRQKTDAVQNDYFNGIKHYSMAKSRG
jgi:hypothetical protein